jgi:hypothetical protein
MIEKCGSRLDRLAVFVAVLGVSIAACAQNEPEPERFTPVADVPQLMFAVLEPAAEVYWDAVGTIIDLEGITEIEPRTQEDWDAVRNAAYVLAESGNLLMMDGRGQEGSVWNGMSQAMVEVGKRALAAAEAQDKAAVFDAGAEVYDVCTACHSVFAVETLRPNSTGGQ